MKNWNQGEFSLFLLCCACEFVSRGEGKDLISTDTFCTTCHCFSQVILASELWCSNNLWLTNRLTLRGGASTALSNAAPAVYISDSHRQGVGSWQSPYTSNNVYSRNLDRIGKFVVTSLVISGLKENSSQNSSLGLQIWMSHSYCIGYLVCVV